MAVRTLTVVECDVFGTTKQVEKYAIKIVKLTTNGEEVAQDEQLTMLEKSAWLSKRAFDRLVKSAKRSLAKPGSEKKETAAETKTGTGTETHQSPDLAL